MHVKTKKIYPNGSEEIKIVNVDDALGEKMIKGGYGVLAGTNELDSFNSVIKENIALDVQPIKKGKIKVIRLIKKLISFLETIENKLK